MSKRDEQKQKRAERQRKQRIYWIIGIVAVAIVVALVLILSNRTAPQTAGDFTRITPVARPQANGLSMGDPNALVKVVEFADFQCPACKVYFNQLESPLVSNYVATGKVYYTFSPFSFIDEFPGAKGNESKNSAAAAYCAADQNKFWEFHDILYTNQAESENSGGFSQVRLLAFGESLGLNMTDFKSCVTSDKYLNQVAQDNAYAEKQKINSTPTFMVNGTPTTMDKLASAIDAAIASGGK